MAKTWKKTSIKVASKDANETARNRSFNNVAENADETKIGQFAQIVEKLTGDSVSSTTVTVVDEIAKYLRYENIEIDISFRFAQYAHHSTEVRCRRTR